MANLLRYVSWRDGQPRFQPSPLLRALGYTGTSLRWPEQPPADWRPVSLMPGDRNDGRWFTRGEAVDWSAAFCKVFDAKQRRRKKRPDAVRKPSPHRLYTVADLFNDWQRSSKWQFPPDAAERQRLRAAKVIYSEKTMIDYRKKAAVIERHDAWLWAAPVDALTQPVLFGLYEELIRPTDSPPRAARSRCWG